MSRRSLEAPLSPLVRAVVAGADGGAARELLAPLTWFDPRGAESTASLEKLPRPEVERRGLAAALARANRSYGHPRAEELAARLADPDTRVVVAGQQPGLLGGPLYTLLKAVAACRWAARCEDAGLPAVALFWAATEDHDYREVATTAVWTHDGLERLQLDGDEGLAPVGTRTLGESVTDVLDRLAENFSYEPYLSWIERMRLWYRPQVRFGEAFSRLLVDLLGSRAPLVVDALDPEVKRRQRPQLEVLVERREEIAAAVSEADARIVDRGMEPRVRTDEDEGHLFVLGDDGRRRVVWVGDDRYSLRGADGAERPIADLRDRIDENPATVSPNVLSRPLVQDALFGTSLQVLGPGELAYMAQAAPLYRLLDVAPPAVTLRPQALVVEERHWRVLDELDLDPSVLQDDTAELRRHAADRERTAFVDSARQAIEEEWRRARQPAVELDANLERPWEKTLEHLRRGLATFEEKATTAAATQDEVAVRRLTTLAEFCFPGGTPHERVLGATHFRGRYGEELVDRLWEELDEEPGTLQVLTPPTS